MDIYQRESLDAAKISLIDHLLDDARYLDIVDRECINSLIRGIHSMHPSPDQSPSTQQLLDALQRRLWHSIRVVERLPNELLFHIFEIASKSFKIGDPNAFPTRASQVCQRWRDLASSPILWTDFNVLVDCRSHVFLQSTIKNISKVLRKSGQLPLDIWFTIIPFTGGTGIAPTPACNVLKFLTTQAARWRSFTMESNTRFPYSILTFPQPLVFPLLEHVNLKSRGTKIKDIHSTLTFTSAFKSAPHIQSLSVEGIHSGFPHFMPDQSSFQWASLVHYSCNIHSEAILKHCVNLKTYTVRNYQDRNSSIHSDALKRRPPISTADDTAQNKPKSLPNLLEITTDDPEVFRHFTFPGLRDLSCYMTTGVPPSLTATFLRLVEGSHPPLQRFFAALGSEPPTGQGQNGIPSDGDFKLDSLLPTLDVFCGSSLEVVSLRLRGKSGVTQLGKVIYGATTCPDACPKVKELRVWVAINSLKDAGVDNGEGVDAEEGSRWQHLLPNFIAKRKSLQLVDITFTPQSKSRDFDADELAHLEAFMIEKTKDLVKDSGTKVVINAKFNHREVRIV